MQTKLLEKKTNVTKYSSTPNLAKATKVQALEKKPEIKPTFLNPC